MTQIFLEYHHCRNTLTFAALCKSSCQDLQIGARFRVFINNQIMDELLVRLVSDERSQALIPQSKIGYAKEKQTSTVS